MISKIDTIAAIATPLGEGGISVLRVSGPDALKVAARGFRGNATLEESSTHTAHFGRFLSPEGDRLDDVVATVFREPHSYTGENVVEISCHGGVYVTRRILEALLEYGARHAQPGEFTKRAFLSGKMDLSQAEAVADLIHSRSEASRRSSFQQLQGVLSTRITELREKLIRTAGLLELELDFVEDGIEFIDKQVVTDQVENALTEVAELLSTYQAGKIVREGVRVVLAGMPNVGKSSILNALLSENRAIVTEVPGTTRDVIEEGIVIEGHLFNVVDTAGLRETVDLVEKEGVRRSHDQIRNSDLLLLVFDSSKIPSAEELELVKRLLMGMKRDTTPCLSVLNKIDLVTQLNGELSRVIDSLALQGTVRISAKTGQGMSDLKKALVDVIIRTAGKGASESPTVTNARHYDALTRAKQSLELSLTSLREGKSSEFVSVDLRDALDSLGEIVGVVTTEDILNEIFSKFCIGK